MRKRNTIVRRSAALVMVGVLIVGALAAAPAGVLSQSDDGPTPTGEDGTYNCGDFDNRQELGEVFDPNNDVNGLDRDGDGVACESLGSNPTPEDAGDEGGESDGDSEAATDTTTATATATATATEEPTETATATATETETATETAEEEASTETTTTETSTETATDETAYYQVDFVAGEPIENLRGPDGTYSNDQLIRFAHGSTDEPVMRLSEGEFTTDDTLADRIESEDIEITDGTATTTFTVAEGDSVTLTLASYQKIGPGWSPETEAQQEFVDSDTQTFESGTHTLTVDLPSENSSD